MNIKERLFLHIQLYHFYKIRIRASEAPFETALKLVAVSFCWFFKNELFKVLQGPGLMQCWKKGFHQC